MKVRIKSNIQNSNSNNAKDVTLLISPSYTVNQLKDHIRSSCFNDIANGGNDTSSSGNGDNLTNSSNTASTISRDRYLRLICSGRLLAPDSMNISEFKCIKDGSVIHAVLAAPGIRFVLIIVHFSPYSIPANKTDTCFSVHHSLGVFTIIWIYTHIRRGGQQAALSRDASTSRNSRPIRFRGIGIGSDGLILPRRNNDDEEDDEEEGDIEEGRQRLGFDRLRAVSLSFLFYFIVIY